MASRRGFLSRFTTPRLDAVGLEIGTSALKLVELKPGAVPSLNAFGVRPMPPGLLQEDHIADANGLAEEIGQLYDEVGINIKRKRQVVTAISNSLAITRNIFVPKMSLSELKEAIQWEAERYIPFPIEEVMLDYYPLDHPDDIEEDGQIEVIIAAARLDVLEEVVETLTLVGLEPVIIDVKPFAALRALKGSLLGEKLSKATLADVNYTQDDEIGVVLEIAANSTTITLVRGERVLMNRNIGVSGDDFTAAIQRSFGLDFDSAEDVKINYGTATIPTEDEEDLLNFDAKREQFSPGRVYEALRPELVELTTEIRRSLEFFRVQAGDATIDRMTITGGSAKLPGLPEAIGHALGFSTMVGDPWLTINVDDAKFDIQPLGEIGPEMSVPIGLALRGVDV